MSIISKLFGYNDIGIDLGSANMRVWGKGRGLVLDEPSVAYYAYSRNSMPGETKPQAIAVGEVSFCVFGGPSDFIAYPMKGGVVPELGILEKFFSYCFERAKGQFRIKSRKLRGWCWRA